MTKEKQKKSKKDVLENWIRLGEANRDSSIFVCLTFNEADGTDGESKQTFFIVHTVKDWSPYETDHYEASKNGNQFVYNNTDVLKDFVTVEAVNIWACSESAIKDGDLDLEIVVKNRKGKIRSIFIDTINNSWNEKDMYPKVSVQDVVINVDETLWVANLDVTFDRYEIFGGYHYNCLNINGRTGVVIPAYEYKLLNF